MAVKLVLTDMDNTLVAYEIPASERAIEGIHKLLDKGILFGPASGRDYDSVVISFRGDRDCVKTALFSNGKRIFVDGTLMNQTRFRHGLDPAEPAGHHLGRPSRSRAGRAQGHPPLDHRHGGPPL